LIRTLLISIWILTQIACKGKIQQESQVLQRPVIKILVAGKTSLSRLHAANIIGKQYGLAYEVVGSCTESEQFRDSLAEYNAKVRRQLNKELGKDWQSRFEMEADSMEFMISQAESFIRLETEYEKKEQELNSRGIYLALWTEPKVNKSVFLVEAYDQPLFSSDSRRKVYYSWIVDLNKRKIINAGS
jgi:hypothetical protein